MNALAILLFLSGLLLAVRVMFFGVQKRVDDEHLNHRRWPLALAAFLAVAGAMLYTRADRVTAGWILAVALAATMAGVGAWVLVQRSAAIPSTDPEDDPRYRFQGHVARVVQAIEASGGGVPNGRIAFNFDGRRHEFDARWSPEADLGPQPAAAVDTEVVIEFVDGDVAFVEPWAVVEKRL